MDKDDFFSGLEEQTVFNCDLSNIELSKELKEIINRNRTRWDDEEPCKSCKHSPGNSIMLGGPQTDETCYGYYECITGEKLKIKPCPWCGGEMDLNIWIHENPLKYNLDCNNPKCSFNPTGKEQEDKEKLIRTWNSGVRYVQ